MKTLVRAFIILTFLLWIAFDIWLASMGGPTESQVIRDWAEASTFFPFLMGFLCGHWFVPRRTLWLSGWMWALPIFGLLIAFDVIWIFCVKTYPWYRYPGLWVTLGIPIGSALWGQPSDKGPI